MASSVVTGASDRPPAPGAGARASALARPSLVIAAALSLGAALVHLQVLPEHWQVWWGYGVFFLLTGVGQALYAGALVRWPNVGVIALGIVGNLMIVATYVWSRTNGIPWGPHANRPDAVNIGDFLTTAGEVLLVVLLVGQLGPRASRWTMTLMMLLGAGLWYARLSGALL